MSSFHFWLVLFGAVVLFSLSVPGNWGRSSWKCFGTTEFLKPAFAKGLSPSRKAPAGRDGASGEGFTLRAARAEQRCQLRNRVLRPRNCARKNDAASELTRRRV